MVLWLFSSGPTSNSLTSCPGRWSWALFSLTCERTCGKILETTVWQYSNVLYSYGWVCLRSAFYVLQGQFKLFAKLLFEFSSSIFDFRMTFWAISAHLHQMWGLKPITNLVQWAALKSHLMMLEMRKAGTMCIHAERNLNPVTLWGPSQLALCSTAQYSGNTDYSTCSLLRTLVYDRLFDS